MASASDQFADAVRELIPINGLPEQHQEEVLRRGKVVKYRKGRYVFKQGDKDNFSFFVLDGALELIADGQLVKQVTSDTADSRHALAQLQPRQLSARAKSPLQIFKIDRTVLDRLLADDRFDDEASQVEVHDLEEESSSAAAMMTSSANTIPSRVNAPSKIRAVATMLTYMIPAM